MKAKLTDEEKKILLEQERLRKMQTFEYFWMKVWYFIKVNWQLMINTKSTMNYCDLERQFNQFWKENKK